MQVNTLTLNKLKKLEYFLSIRKNNYIFVKLRFKIISLTCNFDMTDYL